MFKDFITYLKYFFKRKHRLDENNACFPEITNNIIKFFHFADDIKILNSREYGKINTGYVHFHSDNIYVLVDNFIYSITVMDYFVCISYYYNSDNNKKIEYYDILINIDRDKDKQFFNPKELIFKFLEKKFRAKIRLLKINSF